MNVMMKIPYSFEFCAQILLTMDIFGNNSSRFGFQGVVLRDYDQVFIVILQKDNAKAKL